MKRLASALVLLMTVSTPAFAGARIVTPEPATIGMMAAGLGIVGVGAWWRSRKRR